MSTPTVEDKLASLRGIASIISGGQAATTAWSASPNGVDIVLDVRSGDKAWSISARAGREDGPDQCVDYLLRKMSEAAHRCPSCLGPVARAAKDAKTGRSPIRGYRCPACLHSWQDS